MGFHATFAHAECDMCGQRYPLNTATWRLKAHLWVRHPAERSREVLVDE